ncbi:MAG: hypothetical protein DMF73_02775 [Acidobacteria bacterium]|nr:MAG: hypothetical protein DMF73_02775 [Acidobacteriota bacterium]
MIDPGRSPRATLHDKSYRRGTMTLTKSSFTAVLFLLLSFSCFAQDKKTGAIKGKVRVEKGSPSGVAVILLQGDHEVSRTLSDKRGDFVMSRVAPGTYSVKFRKAGLSVGTIDDVTVRAGQTRPLGDRLYLTIDEGSIAFIRGSVFTEDGRSVPGVRVDLARIINENSTQKLDSRVTGETGEFVFRLPPETAKYRVTLKADGTEPASKDVEVESAVVYRVALAYKKNPK